MVGFTLTAVDFSFARYTAAECKAAGVTTVIRYLTGSGKAITPTELAGFLFGDVAVAFVFEAGANDSAGGRAAGVANATAALKALAVLGLPSSTPVYYAVDSDVAPQSAVPYFQGITAVVSPNSVGVYGEGDLCSLLRSDGLATWYWQSESTSFPGNATTLPFTHIQQKVSGSPLASTDLDLLLKPDVGQVPRPKPAPLEVPIALNFTINGPVADVLTSPNGGTWILGTNGAVYAVKGAPYLGGANGQLYFVGRIAATLTPNGKAGYTITDTVGETYHFGS